MYSLKLELKLNNQQRSFLNGCAGFSRFVYNFGLHLLTNLLIKKWASNCSLKIGQALLVGFLGSHKNSSCFKPAQFF